MKRIIIIKNVNQLIKGNHSFPTHLSSKSSVFNWCEKNNIGLELIESVKIAFAEFEKMPYASVKSKRSKKKIRKYVD